MNLIDRDAVLKTIPSEEMVARMAVMSAPTVDAQPVRHGKWIGKSTGGEYFDCCSECGYVEWDAPNNYCPNCGAKMEEE